MAQPIIERITLKDLPTITRMAYTNMVGVDQQFTRFVNHPITRVAGYIFLPLYFLFSGRGYKAIYENKTVGCAYLHLRRYSGLVFNVSVNKSYRRRGIAQALMHHLEAVVHEHNLSWMTLQVDSENTPAQNLYHQLGYQPYHPTFLLRQPASPRHFTAVPGITIKPLPRSQGRVLFSQFLLAERRESDSEIATMINHEYTDSAPAGGQYWRINYNNTESGCLWLGGDPVASPLLILHLEPVYWGNPLIATSVLRHALDHIGHTVQQLNLHLGSPKHLQAIQSHLQQHGFQTQQHPRILMLKRL